MKIKLKLNSNYPPAHSHRKPQSVEKIVFYRYLIGYRANYSYN